MTTAANQTPTLTYFPANNFTIDLNKYLQQTDQPEFFQSLVDTTRHVQGINPFLYTQNTLAITQL